MVFAQVQVEAGVEDVEPGAHHRDLGDRAAVDLDHAGVAGEDHDRHAFLRRAADQLVRAAGGQRLREARLGQAQRLRARDAALAQQAEELVRVAQAGPAGPEGGDVDLGVRPFLVGDGGGLDLHAGLLVDIGKAGDDGGIGLQHALRAHEDLVDGLAGGIEELQALLQRAVRQALAHRETVGPLRVEEAQVDGAAEYQADVLAARAGAAIDADLLMHAGLVARQRHHLAQRLERFDDPGPFGPQPRRLQRRLLVVEGTEVGGEQFAFGNLQHGGDVAMAGLAFLTGLGEGDALGVVAGLHGHGEGSSEIGLRQREPGPAASSASCARAGRRGWAAGRKAATPGATGVLRSMERESSKGRGLARASADAGWCGIGGLRYLVRISLPREV